QSDQPVNHRITVDVDDAAGDDFLLGHLDDQTGDGVAGVQGELRWQTRVEETCLRRKQTVVSARLHVLQNELSGLVSHSCESGERRIAIGGSNNEIPRTIYQLDDRATDGLSGNGSHDAF